jgi:hypothetical protein
MGFSIFASGSANFHYERDNNIDGDDFTAVSIISAFQTTSPKVADAAGDAAGLVLPSVSITDGMAAAARIELVHLIDLAVSTMAMQASDGAKIFVSCRKTHLLWPDTMASAQYTFDPGDSPGAEFFKAIRPALTATDFDTWGTLGALVQALGRYSNYIDSGTNPRLIIQLTR